MKNKRLFTLITNVGKIKFYSISKEAAVKRFYATRPSGIKLKKGEIRIW